MENLFLINLEERTIKSVQESDVPEIAGITQEEYEQYYNSNPFELNGDIEEYIFTDDENYLDKK